MINEDIRAQIEKYMKKHEGIDVYNPRTVETISNDFSHLPVEVEDVIDFIQKNYGERGSAL